MDEAAWDELVRLMPPHAGAGSPDVDWARVEKTWGTRLPADYQRFIATYGEGAINEYLEIVSPCTADDDGSASEMEEETCNARGEWEPVPVDGPDAAPLIAWGVDASADILCWLTTGDDPDQWPVAVWGRHTDTRWSVYDCGMTEFLKKTFKAEFEECPLSGDDLWDKECNTFLHRALA
ncbi:SMI1/KNR4 family protein [Streptomyces sp. NPDC007100]|uniref:SMI1/KNR4 family protein n=1 Tax=unclassified Streptomyces TaxID=2593676 RepID=UPI0033F6B670